MNKYLEKIAEESNATIAAKGVAVGAAGGAVGFAATHGVNAAQRAIVDHKYKKAYDSISEAFKKKPSPGKVRSMEDFVERRFAKEDSAKEFSKQFINRMKSINTGNKLKKLAPEIAAVSAATAAGAYTLSKLREHNKQAEETAKFQPVDPAHKGLLHKEMGIPEGEPISEESLRKVIATTTNVHTKRRAQFALNARKWHHAKKAENVPPFNEEYTATGTAVAPMADNLLQSGTTKVAEQKWNMSLSDAIKEHRDLANVLRSNNRKAELKELKEQGSELKEMLAKKAEYRNERTNSIANRLLGIGAGVGALGAAGSVAAAHTFLSARPGESLTLLGIKQGLKGTLPFTAPVIGAGALLKLREVAKRRAENS